ncbi:MAG: GTPase [Chloroflexota bacterium]
MPANLTPQYYEAERRFRAAKGPLERIASLEEMLSIMPKHKGTDHLRAELRTKIAKLTQSLDKKTATQRATMMIEKVGAAQVTLAGMANSGKSQLVARLTNATPTVAAYPFTTQAALPGMMPFENIQIQLIDTPPLTDQPPEWWLPHLFRRADGLLLIVDLSIDPREQLALLREQMAASRIALTESKAAQEEVTLTLKPVLVVGNKKDLDPEGRNRAALQAECDDDLPLAIVSAEHGEGLDDLKKEIMGMLDIIRVYTKAPGKKPDFTDPIILMRGDTLEDAAASVHKDFARKMKYARIWGSGKHEGMMAKRDHVLQDGDIIELHL